MDKRLSHLYITQQDILLLQSTPGILQHFPILLITGFAGSPQRKTKCNFFLGVLVGYLESLIWSESKYLV